MTEMEEFLASCPVFQGLSEQQIAEMAPLFQIERFAAGTEILQQGGYSQGVYFLKSGRLAVRVQRGNTRETVALLQPPEVFGELSFLTGRPCVAAVEVVVDAEVALLSKAAISGLEAQREPILRGLLNALASRLQATVTRGATATEPPVVLLRNYPNWEAPGSFGHELALSLARQTGHETLLVNIGLGTAREMREIAPRCSVFDMKAPARLGDIRAELAQRLTDWHGFTNVLLNVAGPDAERIAEAIQEQTNFAGYLLGPGDPVPGAVTEGGQFIVQSAAQPTLELLSGSRQLIQEADEAEDEYRAGRPPGSRFRRTVDSIARCIAGLQVGLALGGGGAWGWAHIGVIAALEDAGVPIDVISGCSMGSVIGAFRAAGVSVAQMMDIAAYWQTRTLRFIEWRFWRMCLLNEGVVNRTFTRYFGGRTVNQTEIPFWANAVDIESGHEYSIQGGTLVDCIRGSIALPGLLPPHKRTPRLLVDAGIMDPVPVRLVREMGCHYAISVNAMAAPGSSDLSRGYPFNAFHVMTRCMFLMGHEIGQARAEKASDVLFTPDLSGISMLQFRRSPEIIERGRRAANERIDGILAGYKRLAQSLPQEQHAFLADV